MLFICIQVSWESRDKRNSKKCTILTRKPRSHIKPRPSGLASRRKLKTLVYLRLRLARPCVHLRWLAMTCAHFGRDQICTQVKARFSPFGHPTQVNANWVTSINGLLANEIQGMSALKWIFCDSRVLVSKLASRFGHPTQVSTQVQLAPNGDYLPVRLTRALEYWYIQRGLFVMHNFGVWSENIVLFLHLKIGTLKRSSVKEMQW